MALTKARSTFDERIDSPENAPLAELVEGIPASRAVVQSRHHGRGYGEATMAGEGDLLRFDWFPEIDLPVRDPIPLLAEPGR